MNKAKLVKHIAGELSTSKTEVLRFVNAFMNAVTQGVLEEEVVRLQGFGCFLRWQQTERPGRNPQTGESYRIRSRVSMKFKPGSDMLKNLNKSMKVR